MPKRGKGGDSLIPDTLPLFMTSDSPIFSGVYGNPIIVQAEISEEFEKRLNEKSYCVIATMLDNGRVYPVGMMGEMLYLTRDGNNFTFNFFGYSRVMFRFARETEGIAEVLWLYLFDIPVPLEKINHPSFKIALEELKASFDGWMECVKSVEKGFPWQADQFFHLPFAQSIIRSIQNIDVEKPEVAADELSFKLDGIMNLLNLPKAQPLLGDVGLLIPSLAILQEQDVFRRLEMVIAFLQHLQIYIPFDLDDAQKDTKDAGKNGEDEGEQPINGVAVSKKTPIVANRALVEEELNKIREVKPRFSPLKQPEEFSGQLITLDTQKQSGFQQSVLSFLDQYLVNQHYGKQQIVRVLVCLKAGLSDPEKPTVVGFFCGPTGVGKTESIRALADFLIGDPLGYVHISCETLQGEHTTAKLIGSPAGYIGFREEAALSQWKLDKPHFLKMLREKYKDNLNELAKLMSEIGVCETAMAAGQLAILNKQQINPRQHLQKLGWMPGKHIAIVLFDEIEKAHLNVFKLLIGALNQGRLQLMNNEEVFLGNTMFAFTSNIYGKQIASKISGRGRMGFAVSLAASNHEELAEEIYRETVGSLERSLPPEILGRIGKENIIVFHPFTESGFREILELMELPKLACRLRDTRNIELAITEEAVKFLINEIMEPVSRSLGARAAASVVDRKLISSISNLVELGKDGGLVAGDSIIIDVREKNDGSGKKEIFIKKVKRSS